MEQRLLHLGGGLLLLVLLHIIFLGRRDGIGRFGYGLLGDVLLLRDGIDRLDHVLLLQVLNHGYSRLGDVLLLGFLSLLGRLRSDVLRSDVLALVPKADALTLGAALYWIDLNKQLNYYDYD